MRYYDSPTARGGHAQESLGQQILRVISNVGFTFFVLAVLTFTVIAVTYQPPDPFVQSAGELRDLLSGVHNATFMPDDTVLVTGEDVLPPASTSLEGALTIDDVQDQQVDAQVDEHGRSCKDADRVDCADPGVKAAIELYNLRHYIRLLYFKYRQPVPVPDEPWACDVAWKYRSRRDRSSRLFRDYRRFTLTVLENCTYEVVDAGQWHSGLGAKPGHVSYVPPPPPPVQGNPGDNPDDGSPDEGTPGEGENQNQGGAAPNPDHAAGTPPSEQGIENGVDTVQVTEISAPEGVDASEFRDKKYLLYETGPDWCKDINHFQWSFLCALGEARYLQRTFVMNLDFCLASANNNGQGDETKDFRMFFDLEHLKNSTPIVEQSSFWHDWNEWNLKHPDDQLQLKEFPDHHTPPQDLKDDSTTLLFRKFNKEQPDNYWYRVCEGPAESVIERPWGMLWKAKTLVNIVEEICGKMEWNFYGLHVVRGDKANNRDQYPNLEADTHADKILQKLRDTLQIQEGSKIYIATNEADKSHFTPLSEYYKIYLRDDFSSLWSDDSEWYQTTKKILEYRQEDWKIPSIKLDPLMELMVDTEVLYRAQKRIETFSDLTSDCKNGVNTC